MATWEFVLVSLSTGFWNGGFAGLFWVYVGTVLCYGSVVASLAEMASMAPTSGGQYHWISEFAPARQQKFLSYATGWMTTLGWLASMAGSVFACADLIQVAVSLGGVDTNSALEGWQVYLIVLALLLVTIGINTVGAGVLPGLETASLFGHILGFLVFVGVFWALCRPLNPAADVFVTFSNNGGWSDVGTACLVSQATVLWCCLGSDTVVHIAEEVQDASLVVPKAMWWSYVLNVFLGFVMLITMLFAIGPLDAVLESDSPYLILFTNVGSSGVALFLAVVLFLLVFAGTITTLAAVSRELWSFSRDKGFPFSGWISRMNHKYHIPFNAIYLSSLGSALLCLVTLGSALAFEIIVSVSILSLLSTYMLSIGCVLLRRVRGRELPPARWSLGRLGLPVNAFAFASFPAQLPVTLETANWAPLVWGGVVLLSVLTYWVHGRRHYTPPVIFTQGKRPEGIALQATS